MDLFINGWTQEVFNTQNSFATWLHFDFLWSVSFFFKGWWPNHWRGRRQRQWPHSEVSQPAPQETAMETRGNFLPVFTVSSEGSSYLSIILCEPFTSTPMPANDENILLRWCSTHGHAQCLNYLCESGLTNSIFINIFIIEFLLFVQ